MGEIRKFVQVGLRDRRAADVFINLAEIRGLPASPSTLSVSD
jgi:hypothetical protein